MQVERALLLEQGGPLQEHGPHRGPQRVQRQESDERVALQHSEPPRAQGERGGSAQDRRTQCGHTRNQNRARLRRGYEQLLAGPRRSHQSRVPNLPQRETGAARQETHGQHPDLPVLGQSQGDSNPAGPPKVPRGEATQTGSHVPSQLQVFRGIRVGHRQSTEHSGSTAQREVGQPLRPQETLQNEV